MTHNNPNGKEPMEETRQKREDCQKLLQNFFAYCHKTNPEGKTELVNYVDWGDAMLVMFLDWQKESHTPHLQDKDWAKEKVKEMVQVIAEKWQSEPANYLRYSTSFKGYLEDTLASQRTKILEEAREKVEKLRVQNKEAKPADEVERIDEQAYEAALREV